MIFIKLTNDIKQKQKINIINKTQATNITKVNKVK